MFVWRATATLEKQSLGEPGVWPADGSKPLDEALTAASASIVDQLLTRMFVVH